MPDEFVIDLEAVTNKLSRISVRKAPGPDGLPNWVLRDYCTLLAGPVCAICNASRGRCAISLERIQRHSNVKSTATAVDRNGFATDLIDCDTGEIIGVFQRVQNQLGDHQYGNGDPLHTL